MTFIAVYNSLLCFLMGLVRKCWKQNIFSIYIDLYNYFIYIYPVTLINSRKTIRRHIANYYYYTTVLIASVILANRRCTWLEYILSQGYFFNVKKRYLVAWESRRSACNFILHLKLTHRYCKDGHLKPILLSSSLHGPLSRLKSTQCRWILFYKKIIYVQSVALYNFLKYFIKHDKFILCKK